MDSTDAPLSVQKQDPPMESTETPGDITEDTVSLEHFLIGRSRQVEKKIYFSYFRPKIFTFYFKSIWVENVLIWFLLLWLKWYLHENYLILHVGLVSSWMCSLNKYLATKHKYWLKNCYSLRFVFKINNPLRGLLF